MMIQKNKVREKKSHLPPLSMSLTLILDSKTW